MQTFNGRKIETDTWLVSFLRETAASLFSREIDRLEELYFGNKPLPTGDQITDILAQSVQRLIGGLRTKLSGKLLAVYNQFRQRHCCEPQSHQIDIKTLKHHTSFAYRATLDRELGYSIPTDRLASLVLEPGWPILEIAAGSGWMVDSITRSAANTSNQFGFNHRIVASDKKPHAYSRRYEGVIERDGREAVRGFQQVVQEVGLSNMVCLLCCPPLGTLEGVVTSDILMPSEAIKMLRPGDIFVHVGKLDIPEAPFCKTGLDLLNRALHDHFEQKGETDPLYQWPDGHQTEISAWRKRMPAEMPSRQP
jgi:hypothetical protein